MTNPFTQCTILLILNFIFIVSLMIILMPYHLEETCVCSFSFLEAEAEGSRVQSQPDPVWKAQELVCWSE